MGLELEAVGTGHDGHLRPVFAGGEDAADLGDGDAGDGAGDFGGGGGGEEELVVFAAVEQGGDLGAVVEGDCERVQREGCEVEFGRDVGGGAEVGEVGGEAVAEVDAGGGEVAAEEGLADGEARLGEEVGVVVCGGGVAEFARGGGEGGELGCGSAEGSGDVDEVAGVGSRAAEGAACGCGAEEDDVGEDEVGGGLRGVAAGEGDVVRGGEG